MRSVLMRLGLLLGVLCSSPLTQAAEPTAQEMTLAREWLTAHVPVSSGPQPAGVESLPFSFVYDGKPSRELLGSWKCQETAISGDKVRSRRTRTYHDPASGLTVRWEIVSYQSYPVVEWTVWLVNEGTADTAILENIQGLDASWESFSAGKTLLHHSVGSPCTARDFEPLETPLATGQTKRITAAGGRPTHSDLCYFNLQGDTGGVILAIGWPGQWAAEFARDAQGRVGLRVGQEKTHLRLQPGEAIRTPLVVLQFWEGDDWIRAQNVWRRWMVDCNLPRPGGQPLTTHYDGCGGNPLPKASEEIAWLKAYQEAGIQLDHWILDAGWYLCRGSWENVGTWEPDPERFPKGLREVADQIHAQGAKFVVWFEPERVRPGSWLAETHPEWLLPGTKDHLLNLGHPEAWHWLVEHIDGLLTSQQIDVYRQDYNIDPLSYWRQNDAEDRQGITENKYVTGYLAYWDELLRRRPGLWIDSCASGGRRNDLETLRRAVPLLRSDWAVISSGAAGALGQQGQTYGLSLWMPYHGTGTGLSDPYVLRSSFCPSYRIGWDYRQANLDKALLRRTVEEYRRIAPHLLGDFYPLTPYSLDNKVWIAWQFDGPEPGAGVVQAFRRPECPSDTIQLRLKGLDESAIYAVTDLDTGTVQQYQGRELREAGLGVRVSAQPGSALLTYQKKAP